MPIALIVTVLGLAEKYGPTIFQVIKDLTNKKDATIDDVEKAYLDLRPYEAFGIPDKAPSASLVPE